MNELGTFLTVNELAQALGVCRATVFGLVRRGILPKGVLIGHSRRWQVSEIQAALSAMKCETTETTLHQPIGLSK